MAPAAGVAFGGDQHVLAERRQAMTADRAAIRRGLAAARAACRPPARRWQGRGHTPIVAPLAATVLASLTVGAIALAKGERERRVARAQRARERRFTLLEGERPRNGMKRMALAQLDLAIELVRGEGGVGQEEAVHDTRKAIKRLRALTRLLREELGEQTFARENEALRDIARRLAGARDAEVMVSTLDQLLKGHERLARRRPVAELRAQLVAERDRAARREGDAATRDATLGELYAVRARVAAWPLPERPGLQLVEPGLRDLYRQGRRRYDRARHAKERSDARVLHQWRKRAKDLRYAAQMLGLEKL